MDQAFKDQAFEKEVFAALEETLEAPLHRRENSYSGRPGAWEIDLVAEGAEHVFVVECKSTANARGIEAGIQQLRRALHWFSNKPAIHLIAVPFMGEVGKRLCREASVSWIDLAGNADLRGPGLRIRLEGRPNRHPKPGRPPNVFAPKSARVTRRLLLDPARSFRQRELAQETKLGEGFVSRIVRQLETEGFVSREDGVIRARKPGLLLEAWREAYAFDRHHIIRGHIASRSPQALLSGLADAFQKTSTPYAATGLASAWLYTRFAGFRLVTIYVRELPPLSALDFRAEPRGANVWLIVPDDPGVFDGAAALEGINCCSAVQTYLDLHALPERAQEAAGELLGRQLAWSVHV